MRRDGMNMRKEARLCEGMYQVVGGGRPGRTLCLLNITLQKVDPRDAHNRKILRAIGWHKANQATSL